MRNPSIALTRSVIFAALIFGVPLLVSAQNREKFVISARAGGVNAVTGRAAVRGQGTGEWQQLMITADLERGDVVKTGQDGRVEILLNPGSYMRIAENSEFELSDNSLENLEVRLIRGTAIMEVTGAEDTALLINIITPHTRMAIVRRGLYRVNVVPGDATELIVRKGRVMLEGSHTKVKGGDKVVISGQSYSVAKLNKAEKKSTDGFEVWSKGRAETVAEANRKFRRKDLSLLMAGYNDPWSGNYGGGMWVYNFRAGCFTFMPFFSGWGSPYGNSYSSAFYGGYYGAYFGASGGPYRPYPVDTSSSGPRSTPSSAPSGGMPSSGPSSIPATPAPERSSPPSGTGNERRAVRIRDE
jgi:hypothetical protein